MRTRTIVCLLACLAVAAARESFAQERPYFVTYDHYLEEPGNLEVALAVTAGDPREADGYAAPWLELEYGIAGWWTTELYLESVFTSEGSGLTGWRWENRFRPMAEEHAVNPVLYVEYEDISEASRIQKEIVGSGGFEDEPISELREEHEHEIEAKLILSSALGSWNLSENFVFEKNLSEDEGIEFGYALGVSRSLGGLARPERCTLCRESFVVGVEAYGGLGSTEETTLAGTRHFVAPVMSWRIAGLHTLRASVGFGLTDESEPVLARVGWSYEFPVR
jgi:hypothetical protein